MITQIIGVDPGYDRLGVAIVERVGSKENLIFSDCISSTRTNPFPLRLKTIGQAFEKLIKKYSPQAVALEKVFFANNKKTAATVSEVRGMLAYIAAIHHLPIVDLTPLQVKVAVTGYGTASKDQVAIMVKRLITTQKILKSDDEIDAIAIAIAGLSRAASLDIHNQVQ